MEEPWGPAEPRMGALHDPPARAAHLAVPAPSDLPKVIRERISGSFGRSALFATDRLIKTRSCCQDYQAPLW